MSVDLETKLSSRNFSQKTNGRICFSILMTGKYLKLEFWFQVFPSHQDRKSISFFGRSYGSTILFPDLLTFRLTIFFIMGQSMTTKLLLAPFPPGFLDLPMALLCKISRISRVEAHTEPICLTYFLLTKKISKCFKMYKLQLLIFRLHAAADSLITVYFFFLLL